jgi:hypothetical protein
MNSKTWQHNLKEYIYEVTCDNSYSWKTPDYVDSLKIDELVNIYNQEVRKQNMPYISYEDYDKLNKTSKIAKDALDALEQGLTLDQLLEKNPNVRVYWNKTIKERDAAKIKAAREKERRRLAAEKRAIEDATRAEVARKLTPEELEAFGLTTTGKSKRK